MFQCSFFFVLALCDAGSYSDGEVCIPCSIGQNQPYHSQTFCFECESGSTTEMEGATNVAECIGGKNEQFVIYIEMMCLRISVYFLN